MAPAPDGHQAGDAADHVAEAAETVAACPLTAEHLALMAGLGTGVGDPAAAVARLLRLAADASGADGAVLARVDHALGAAVVLAVHGDAGIAAGERLSADDPRVALPLEEDAPVAVADCGGDRRWSARGRDRTGAPGAYVGAPLRRSTGRAFGVLACVGAAPRPFAPAQADLVAVLAIVAAPLALRLEALRGETPPTSAERVLARFRMMVEHASDLLAEVDASGRIRYANPAFCDLLGLSPQDSLASSLLDLVDPRDAQAWAVALARMGANPGPPRRLRGRLRQDDGSWRVVEASLSNQIHTDGVNAVVLAAHDVTDRVAAETALAAERDRLRDILDAVPDPVFLKDADGRLLRINRAAAAAWGLPNPAAAVGLRTEEVLPPESAAAALAEDAEVLATGRRIKERLHRFEQHGEHCWYLHDKSPLRGDDGAIVGLVGAWRDVTALEEARAALDDERRLLQAVIDALPQMVSLKDLDGRYQRLNAAAVAASGFASADDVVGHSIAAFAAAATIDAVAADEAEAMTTGRAVGGRLFSTGEGPTERWFEASKVPIRGRDGEIVGLVGSTVEVTDRVRADRRVREERDLLQAVMDAIPDVLAVKDAEGRYLRLNRAAAARLGLEDPAAAVGQLPGAFWPPGLADATARADARALAGEPVAAVVEPEPGGADDGRWFLTARAPLRSADGRVTGLVVASRDVTAIKQAEDALAAERDLLRAVLEAIPDPVFVKDREGRVIRANRAWVAENGFADASEVLGKDAAALLGEAYAARYAANEAAILAGADPVSNVHEVWEDDGERFHYLVSKAVWRNAAGEPMGVVGAYRDVTERVNAEAVLADERDVRQAILDALPDRVVALGRDGSVRFANRAAGVAAGSFLSEAADEDTIDDRTAPAGQAAPAELEDARAVVATGEPTVAFREEPGPDGSPRRVLARALPLREADGTVAGAVSSVVDVTSVGGAG